LNGQLYVSYAKQDTATHDEATVRAASAGVLTVMWDI
jgi:hypothetical protein